MAAEPNVMLEWNIRHDTDSGFWWLVGTLNTDGKKELVGYFQYSTYQEANKKLGSMLEAD